MKDVYREAVELVSQAKVKLTGVVDKGGLLTRWFEVEGNGNNYQIRIFSNILANGQIIHRCSCPCVRGSLISPKYNTFCKHTLACQYYIMRSMENGSRNVSE